MTETDSLYWLETIRESCITRVAIHRERVQRMIRLVGNDAAALEERELAQLALEDAVIAHAENELRIIQESKH